MQRISYPAFMGILNVTPDSFSDGGAYADEDAVLKQARTLIAEGAQILDVGGESTRPGFTEVSAQEETARVVPVIRRLAAETKVPISIDTRKSSVAEAALRAGACFVNDISGGTSDPEILSVAADFHVAVCLGDVYGPPEKWHEFRPSADIVSEVRDRFLRNREAALSRGIAADLLFLDPGIGFGKTAEQNWALLERIGEFRNFGCRLVVGVSRKRFLGGKTIEEKDRLTAQWSKRLFAAGVDLVRVHRCFIR